MEAGPPWIDPDLQTFDRIDGRRCVLIGEERLLIQCAELLEQDGFELAAIIGRASVVTDWAKQRGLPLLPRIGALPSAGVGPFDYLFSIANLAIIPDAVLAMPRRLAVNFHNGPLPAYAGLNTPSWALLAGEARHGVTWHVMTPEVDGGDILASQSFDIEPGETALSLNTRCFDAALRSFGPMIRALKEPGFRPAPQGRPADRVFGLDARPADAGLIDWTAPAEEIARLVRALDFGGYANPLGCARARIDGAPVLIQAAEAAGTDSGAPPGSVVHRDDRAITVATGDGDLRVSRIVDPQGRPFDLASIAPGARFDAIDPAERAFVAALDRHCARHEGWWRDRLSARDDLRLPEARPHAAGSPIAFASRDLPVAGRLVLTALVAFLGRVVDRNDFTIGYRDACYGERVRQGSDWFAPCLPLHAVIDDGQGVAALDTVLAGEIAQMHRRLGFAADFGARWPAIGATDGYPVEIRVADGADDAPLTDADLSITIDAARGIMRWRYRTDAFDAFDAAHVDALCEDFLAFLRAAEADPARPIRALPIASDGAAELIGPQGQPAQAAGIHLLFAAQAARTPDRPAVTANRRTLTYRELDARSNRMAHLLQALDVGPDVLVGLHMARSVEMLVALVAIHKAGGAYVPLDPAYPRARLAHMVQDSGLRVIVSDSDPGDIAGPDVEIIGFGPQCDPADACPDTPVVSAGGPDNLAYVIYTSGSTGVPKGVMVEHRNLLNFFAGMDRQLEPDGAWLAVTSLSFDISVLELCWTITRGYHVVIATPDEIRGGGGDAAAAPPPGFSLFYFASADDGPAAERYRLLLEGARFADAHGFEAVWTPERHFHSFGGLYPNPAVSSAAVAAITTRVAIRGGSVVAPLHHPARIAEEWALVDNLSGGRVGIAFASGWQPNDFLLQPGNFADRSGALLRTMADVQGLWRGEARSYDGPLGTPVLVTTYPRPLQPELPVWMTTAGNPATFAAAGRAGANVLTHLLGQSVAELSDKLAAYRAARREAGHEGPGRITLMLHTLIGEDRDEVRRIVRQPMIDYLRTSTNLVQQHAWSFPAFQRRPGMEKETIDLAALAADEMDSLLEHAFDRYFESSGLFGTLEDCDALIRELRGIGVDEIACLIDFGVPAQQVLDRLPLIEALRQRTQRADETGDDSLPGLIRRHGVTHLQCTPSLAQMLVADEAGAGALGQLSRMMVGGEAFPPALATALRAHVAGPVMNMYGPTETTIWSSVHTLADAAGAVPLGAPLMNQSIRILDSRQRPVRPGAPGELVIAGDGVTRGYLNRPELTAERFPADPDRPGQRMYRTGDLARLTSDGRLEFLGRLDHQVKLRGHRIELGEIEAALADVPGIAEAAVVAAGEGEARLVAYIVASGGVAPDAAVIRRHLLDTLPEIMAPSRFVPLPALPRTANGKLDRNALPDPAAADISNDAADYVAPASALQETIAAIWCDVLKLPHVGTRDNFFDLGGHSLLAVQAHRRLAAALPRPLALTDIFRFPTIEALSTYAGGDGQDDSGAKAGLDRANSRRTMLQRRQALRAVGRS